MGILNYTTVISASKTLAEIQELLAKAGAKKIMVDYDDNQQPSAVSFLVKTMFGDRGFHLPANIDAVFTVLCAQASARKIGRGFATREQAARVGWRIVKDWLAAQMAIVEAEVVTFEQVMLPYMVVETDKTVYQLMIANHLALPAPKE